MLLGYFGVAIGHRGYHHICSRREWFFSLEKLGCGIVIMGNDAACQMIGIGIVRIKMFNGVVRDLTDVRYVPHMKRTSSQLERWSRKGSR